MHGGPRLVPDTMVENRSGTGPEPRVDWANGLMREVHDHLLQCALHYVRGRDTAEELAQAVAAELWIDHGDEMIRFDEEPFKAFLSTVVQRRVLDLRRRTQVRKTYEDEYRQHLEQHLSVLQKSPELEQSDREFLEQLGQAVNDLSPALQDIYRLHLNGLRHKEIAEHLNLKPTYTPVALTRATERVREKLVDWAPASYVAKSDDVPRKPGRPRLRSPKNGRDV